MISHTHGTIWHKHRLCLMLLIGMVAEVLIASAVVAQSQQIGYVLNLRGDWVLNASHQLKPGDSVPAGGTIQLMHRVAGEFIEIVDNDSHPIEGVSRNCDNTRCDRPIKLPALDRRNIVLRLLDGAMEMFRDYPDLRKPIAISRGTEFQEAVVKLENEQLDLSPVLTNLNRGRYLLRLETVSLSSQRATKVSGPITVDWNPNRPAIASVESLVPGLYIAQPLGNADREPLEPGTESMVLLVTPSDFEKDALKFNEAVRLTNSWGTSIRHESKRKFLRAVLASLAANTRR